MGTNEDSATTNLKVPPLKIVLTSNPNNAVITDNISSDETISSEQSSFKSSETNDNSDELADQKETKGDSGVAVVKSEKTSSGANNKNKNAKESESYHQSSGTSSSSSSSTSSDRSKSTSPSSESESVASNATIISDQHQQQQQQQQQQEQQQQQQQQQIQPKQSKQNDTIKHDKNSKQNKPKQNNMSNSNNGSSNNKKSPQSNADLSSETTSNINNSKEQQTLNANQRITRSSQRAAQQIKTENSSESNNEEHAIDIQDKLHESARKAKRKKGEAQEVAEQDNALSTDQPTINMSEIYPADYQLPAKNSFELYSDIRKRPYKKLMKLNYIKPRVPNGFKYYLMSGGPYLLEGNKLGNGLFGARLENMIKCQHEKINSNGLSINSAPIRKKITNLHHKIYQPSQQRHNSYVIPVIQEPPKNLQNGLPLYELFKDQEKARQQMRMQHLKERERSILTVEQEILRAYNRSAIANVQQKLHLSACTYLYYQERYHYMDEKKSSKKPQKTVENNTTTNNDDSNVETNDLLCTETELKEEPMPQVEEESPSSGPSSDDDAFLEQLQEIDEKWAKIMKDMQVRHKNEADSLHAVQSLEWEWKAKEIGSCDFRLSLKIEPEFVPRVNVVPMDY